MSKTIRIPVKRENVRSFRESDSTKHILNVSLSDYPADQIRNYGKNNPRSHGEESDGSNTKTIKKRIKDTIEFHPESFHMVNKGGLLICGNGSRYNDSEEIMTVVLTDWEEQRDFTGWVIKPMHGLADGGTTNDAIYEFREDNPTHPSLFVAKVQIEILAFHADSKTEELLDRIRRICEGRNTSVAVKKWGLESYKGEYNSLLRVCKDNFPEVVGADEYALPEVNVQDVVQWLSLLTPGKENNPTSVWNSKGSITTYYSRNKSDFEALAGLLPSYLRLMDYIVQTGHEKFRDFTGKSLARTKSSEGKEHDDLFGKLKGVENLVFLGVPQEYKFPKAMLFPLLYSFRALIDEGRWKSDPFVFWDEHGGELLKMAIDHFKEQHKSNVHAFSRDKSIFGSLCDRVKAKLSEQKAKLLEEEVARLREKK